VINVKRVKKGAKGKEGLSKAGSSCVIQKGRPIGQDFNDEKRGKPVKKPPHSNAAKIL